MKFGRKGRSRGHAGGIASGTAAQPARRDAGAPTIDHDRDDDRAADHDPFIVLVEV